MIFHLPNGHTTVTDVAPEMLRRHHPANPVIPHVPPSKRRFGGGRGALSGLSVPFGDPVGGLIVFIVGLLLLGAILYGAFYALPFYLGDATWGRLHPWDTDMESPLVAVRVAAGYCIMAAVVTAYILVPLPWRRSRRRSSTIAWKVSGISLALAAGFSWLSVLPDMENRAKAQDRLLVRSLTGDPTAFQDDAARLGEASGDIQKNMLRALDDNPKTAWRFRGDAKGRSPSIIFGIEFDISSVGLVPGYAENGEKTRLSEFRQDRRIAEVRWRFVREDGTESMVVQRFKDKPAMQIVAVREKGVREIKIEILKTLAGSRKGASTAISTIHLVGREHNSNIW